MAGGYLLTNQTLNTLHHENLMAKRLIVAFDEAMVNIQVVYYAIGKSKCSRFIQEMGVDEIETFETLSRFKQGRRPTKGSIRQGSQTCLPLMRMHEGTVAFRIYNKWIGRLKFFILLSCVSN